MTQLLEEAIAQLKQLPEDLQDAIASRLLAEIEDEQQWIARFESTTDEQWEAMARSVRQEIKERSGTPGRELLRFAGSIPTEDLKIMADAIQEDCSRIDIDEW
ncbi:hypothetical protein [Roseofilum casamattae]|uniref:DUF4351 domain-containing protein n=1 Tax=Roseofilum casamattae BLCC-M143 TaxID=3022442 RepID=A0ABT7BTJ9_9CYAN|nr:hypothetical protein [Roseofilum casamattae]MDJ1181628.1 hypothetical protein [Roseofilum casamattae BLCC-M143]